MTKIIEKIKKSLPDWALTMLSTIWYLSLAVVLATGLWIITYFVWSYVEFTKLAEDIVLVIKIVLEYVIRFLSWDFGPIMSYWNLIKITSNYLYLAICSLAMFYTGFVQFIYDNMWVVDIIDSYFKIFLAFNSTYIILIVFFAFILLMPVCQINNIFSKKLWFYTTIFVFFITLFNLHYINALQIGSSDYLNNFKVWTHADENGLISENIRNKADLLLFKVHSSKKIGLIMCVLVSYIFILCAYIKQIVCTKNEILLYMMLEFFLLKAFTTSNLLEFYIYYEAVLIPMYLLIIGWGSGEAKKVLAAYYLLFYTVVFSIPFLTAVLYLGHLAGSYDLLIIRDLALSPEEEFYIFIAFFLGFAVKIPMFPFHIWLPEAHVNAPTTASVILASLLLKLGGYGMIVFLLPVCKNACFTYLPVIYTLIIISIIYGSMAAIVQTDLKRIVAYSSVAHMNLAVLGIFSWNSQGLQGCVYQMISHGIISAALFFLIGFLYDRHHTRDITYYGGLTTVMPVYSTNFFFFTIANMGFPGTSAFVGELLIFIGSFKHNTVVSTLALAGAFLSAVYSIWMFNRIFFGSLNTTYLGKTFFDLNRQEAVVMLYLFIPLIVLGVCPNIILDYLWFTKYFF